MYGKAETLWFLNETYVHTTPVGLYGGVHSIERTAILIDLHTQQAQESFAQIRIDLKAKGEFTHHCTRAWKHEPASVTSNYGFKPKELSITVFKDVTSCSIVERYPTIGENCCLPVQGRRERAGYSKTFLSMYQTKQDYIPAKI